MLHIYYFKTKLNKNQNLSIWAPLSAARIDILQFIQEVFLLQYIYRKLIPFNG